MTCIVLGGVLNSTLSPVMFSSLVVVFVSPICVYDYFLYENVNLQIIGSQKCFLFYLFYRLHRHAAHAYGCDVCSKHFMKQCDYHCIMLQTTILL